MARPHDPRAKPVRAMLGDALQEAQLRKNLTNRDVAKAVHLQLQLTERTCSCYVGFLRNGLSTLGNTALCADFHFRRRAKVYQSSIKLLRSAFFKSSYSKSAGIRS